MSFHEFIARNFKPASLPNIAFAAEKTRLVREQLQQVQDKRQRGEMVADILNPYFAQPGATFIGAAKKVAPIDPNVAYKLGVLGTAGKRGKSAWSNPFTVEGIKYQKNLDTNQWKVIGLKGKKGVKSPGYPGTQELDNVTTYIEQYGDEPVQSMSPNERERFEVHIASRAKKIQKDEGVDYTEAVQRAYQYWRQYVQKGEWIEKKSLFGVDWFWPDKKMEGTVFSPPAIGGTVGMSKDGKRQQILDANPGRTADDPEIKKLFKKYDL